MLGAATDYALPSDVHGDALSLSNRLVAGFGCLAALLLRALVYAVPAGAQEASNGAEANETVQIVKSSLMGIAIALLLLTIFYWIHTDPKRRARAHAKKAARKQAFAEAGESDSNETNPRPSKLERDAPVDSLDDVVMLDGHDGEAAEVLGMPDVEREVS